MTVIKKDRKKPEREQTPVIISSQFHKRKQSALPAACSPVTDVLIFSVSCYCNLQSPGFKLFLSPQKGRQMFLFDVRYSLEAFTFTSLRRRMECHTPRFAIIFRRNDRLLQISYCLRGGRRCCEAVVSQIKIIEFLLFAVAEGRNRRYCQMEARQKIFLLLMV